MSYKPIPVCEPTLDGNELEYVIDAINTGWISSAGKYISKFEASFAEFCGAKHGIAVCNGTVALHLALIALGIGKGDEVIVPNFTMIASAFSICYTGAMPVFIDIDPKTWNIDVDKIEEKITLKTKAIMVVHIYGQPCEMDSIYQIATKYNLKIIEDAAEVHGATYKGVSCGSLGDVAAFSFFANKIITTGEGGMVITDDDEIAERCRYYKNLCFPLDGNRTYLHNDIGFNYRMSNVIAAIGFAQTEKASRYVAMRIKNNLVYRENLKDIKGISFQQEQLGSKNVYWMNGISIDKEEFGFTRNDLIEALKKYNIECRRFFIGLNQQPSLKQYGCDCGDHYPITDRVSNSGLYLPSSSSLTEETIKYICNIIKEIHAYGKHCT